MKFSLKHYLVCVLPVMAAAANASIQYVIGIDGNVKMSIAGTLRASYDSDYLTGNNETSLLDLTGWQDFSLVYYNKYGSNCLQLYSRSDTASLYDLVSKVNMRSQDDQGNWINGLRADYYNIDTGAHITTIYGEGVIDHGARWISPGNLGCFYEGDWGLWAGRYDGWGKFEERLSGQVYTGSSVPGPLAVLPMALGLLVGLTKRRRSH